MNRTQQSAIYPIINQLQKLLIVIFITLFPALFSPFFSNIFYRTKFFFLFFISLLIFLLSLLKLILDGKIYLKKDGLWGYWFLIIVASFLSILIGSVNKVQAIFNFNNGAIIFLLFFFLFIFARPSSIQIFRALTLSSIIILSLNIVFLIFRFTDLNLPSNWQFVKEPFFSPIGPMLVAFFYHISLITFSLIILLDQKNYTPIKTPFFVNEKAYLILIIFLNLVSIIINPGYQIVDELMKGNNPLTDLIITPLSISWFAVLEMLKNPITAIFGYGVDNFSIAFNQAKNLQYNLSNYWQIPSFQAATTNFLNVLVEMGLLGIFAFGVFFWFLISKHKTDNQKNKKLIFLLLVFFAVFPTSLIFWFVFYLFLLVATNITNIPHLSTQNNREEIFYFSLDQTPPLFISALILSSGLCFSLGLILINLYRADYAFQKGLNSLTIGNLEKSYQNLRQAKILMPFFEDYRINFSRVNLLIASSIIDKANKDNKNLTENERQTLIQALQTAIEEAKQSTILNSRKSENWGYLAFVYKTIINQVDGASLWAIASYQRAIVLDPKNPSYFLELGGIYYSLGQYEEATKNFEEAVKLKPNWANAHYNLAWSEYQRKNYSNAALAMKNTLLLINQKDNPSDYEKAKKELEDFEKKIAEENRYATESSQTTLKLPERNATDEAELQLPENLKPDLP